MKMHDDFKTFWFVFFNIYNSTNRIGDGNAIIASNSYFFSLHSAEEFLVERVRKKMPSLIFKNVKVVNYKQTTKEAYDDFVKNFKEKA